MSKCIKCGSYAFNLYKENIDQGGLCDVHYWQGRAHRAEAKQEQGEPVAWLDEADLIFRVDWKNKINYNGAYVDLGRAIPDRWKPVLYTTPQQRKPLAHEQRFDLLTQFEPHKNKWEAPAILIDMVEAAHGIKE